MGGHACDEQRAYNRCNQQFHFNLLCQKLNSNQISQHSQNGKNRGCPEIRRKLLAEVPFLPALTVAIMRFGGFTRGWRIIKCRSSSGRDLTLLDLRMALAAASMHPPKEGGAAPAPRHMLWSR